MWWSPTINRANVYVSKLFLPPEHVSHSEIESRRLGEEVERQEAAESGNVFPKGYRPFSLFL